MRPQIYICDYPETQKFAEAVTCDDTVYDYDTFEKCPLCGRGVSGSYWLKPRKVDVDRKKLPDFLYITGGTGTFLISERVWNAFQTSGLTGIKAAVEIDDLLYRGKSLVDGGSSRYYMLELARSKAAVDHEKSSIVYGDTHEDRVCSLCDPKGATYDFFRGLHLDMENYEGYDIFTSTSLVKHSLFHSGSSISAAKTASQICMPRLLSDTTQ